MMMIPHVPLVFLCPLVVVVAASTPERWDNTIFSSSNYALFWKNRTVVRDSDGSNIVSHMYDGEEARDDDEDESTGERDDEDKEDFVDRNLEDMLDEPKATSEDEEEEGDDSDFRSTFLDMRVLLDDKLLYRPYDSTVYLHFYRRDDHEFVDLKFDPCSDLDYYSDEWKEQGCNHTALTTTEELSSGGEVTGDTLDDDTSDEGEDEFDNDEKIAFGDYFDENGTYVGPDYSNNLLHPDRPDGGGWRLSQSFVVDKKTNTTFRWENPASTLGVNHDLDFLFCETVKFTLTADGEDDTTTTTATMSFENVLLSVFLDLRWTCRVLDGYVGMRITSPCQEDEICEAVNGNVACLATADGETTSRKDYFANITTLEYVDGVRMEEA